uniref:Uncharacterized protein n=1 Tax=Rhizophora mucronata TaxID=61149 RepID=A0A2P2P3X3_RHIMU
MGFFFIHKNPLLGSLVEIIRAALYYRNQLYVIIAFSYSHWWICTQAKSLVILCHA